MRKLDYEDIVFRIFISIVGTAFCFGALLMFIASFYEFTGIACHNSAKMKGLEYHYSFTTGCMVKYKSTWVLDRNMVAVENDDGTVKYLPNSKIRIIQEIK